MNFKIILITIITVIFSANASGQTKYEKEYRIKEKDAPGKAVSFIKKSFTKCKWYSEESSDGKTFEAKGKLNGYKFSIEFDTTGNIIDVEKTVKFENMDSEIKQNINKSLLKIFTSYKIKKAQIQWIACDNTLHELISYGHSKKPYTLNYELVLKAKKDSSTKFYEILSDKNGNILKVSEIISRPTDNLDF